MGIGAAAKLIADLDSTDNTSAAGMLIADLGATE